MSQNQPVERVLLLAHGWGYNHRFFDPLLRTLPSSWLDGTLVACLEAGYFPEQAGEGLMLRHEGEWTHHPMETLHSLVLGHANVPWLGLGHSLGFSGLLEYSVRWHTLISVHGFTRFVRNELHPEGTPARLLGRMLLKAQTNMAGVLTDFHLRCGHQPGWSNLDEQLLLKGLDRMQTLDCGVRLQSATDSGSQLFAVAGIDDPIVPLGLSQSCFHPILNGQGRSLHTLDAEHAELGRTPSRYTDALLPLISLV